MRGLVFLLVFPQPNIWACVCICKRKKLTFTMTCIYPSSNSPFHKEVPQLKDLATKSCSQNVLKEYLTSIKRSLRSDAYDNNDKKNYRGDAICDDPPMICDMKIEANRLKSFSKGWPLSFIKPEECAAVGLYYLGESDKVKCTFCTGIITNWENGDKPLVEHVKHFPMCPYLLNREVGNVPISGSNGSQPWQISNAHAERATAPFCNARHAQPTIRTKYMYMVSLDKRVHTFHNWQHNVISTAVTPLDLAEAGFFYTGVADVVTCYCCGGQVGGWDYGDEPWTEHAKHYPTCSFVKNIKGSTFIEQARMQYVSDNSACGGEEPSVSACASSGETTIKKLDEDDVKMYQEMEAMEITENTASKDGNQFMCKICMDLGTRVAFIPCGHSMACPKCAKELSTCPLCRSKIHSVVRLYFD